MLDYYRIWLIAPRLTMTARYSEDIQLPQGMLTVAEVSQLLHIHPNTVRTWSDSGLLKAYRLGHRRDRRFRPEDISKFLNVMQI
ncbi:helix-turn-helix domain-containing protein [Chloroflexota bacterium]